MRASVEYVHGTNAMEIYIDCCRKFGWNKHMAHAFDRQRPLYARHVADAGKRDVWFICKSNFKNDLQIVDRVSKTIKHRNWIDFEKGRIFEFQQDAPYLDEYPMAERITFALTKKGYVFLGVYKAQDPNSKSPDRVFELVSKEYPV